MATAGLFGQVPNPSGGQNDTVMQGQDPSGPPGQVDLQPQSKPSFSLQDGSLDLENPDPPLSDTAMPIVYRPPQAESEHNEVSPTTPNSSSGEKTGGGDPRVEIERILQCAPNEWYNILDVGDMCTREEANTAYRMLILMIHPDRCNLEGATEASACK